MIEHILSKHDLLDVKLSEAAADDGKVTKGKSGKNKETFKRFFDYSTDLQTLMNAINEANDIIRLAASDKHKVSNVHEYVNTKIRNWTHAAIA